MFSIISDLDPMYTLMFWGYSDDDEPLWLIQAMGGGGGRWARWAASDTEE